MSQDEFDYQFHCIVAAFHEERLWEIAFVLIVFANYLPEQGSQDDGCGDKPGLTAPVRRTQL